MTDSNSPVALPSLPDGDQRVRAVRDVARYTLPNGLRVWAHPRPGTGTFALAMQIRVGARYESRRNNGISHFLEHMLFTGTERWSENEVMDVIRQRGGMANAQTSHEDTVIYLHVDAEHQHLALEWLHQVVFRPTLQPDKVEKERRVIINEKGGEFGRLRAAYEWIEAHHLGWNVGKTVQRQLFPESPLLMPVIGTDESLRQMDHAALLDFYRAYYVPNNMTLIAVGDFQPELLQTALRNVFGGEPSAEVLPEQTEIRYSPAQFRLHLHGPAPNEQGQLLIGAPLGPDSHPDRFAWWVLVELLERSITQEVRFRRGLTYDVSAFTSLYAEGGYLGIYVRTESQHFDEICALAESELNRIEAGELAPGELDNVRMAMRGRALLSLQSNLDFLWWHAVDTLTVNDDEPIPDYFGELECVDGAALQRIVSVYLRPEQRFQVIHRPMLTPRRMGRWGLALLATVSLWAGRRRLRMN